MSYLTYFSMNVVFYDVRFVSIVKGPSADYRCTTFLLGIAHGLEKRALSSHPCNYEGFTPSCGAASRFLTETV